MQARNALALAGRRGGGGGGRGRQQQAQQAGVTDQLKGHAGVPMSLTIRASRNLPLPLLSQEFERILQRRYEKVRAEVGVG